MRLEYIQYIEQRSDECHHNELSMLLGDKAGDSLLVFPRRSSELNLKSQNVCFVQTEKHLWMTMAGEQVI
jgi:hypothetical protein